MNLLHAIGEWIRVTEIEHTTGNPQDGYIDRTFVPALDSTPIRKPARTGEVLRRPLSHSL